MVTNDMIEELKESGYEVKPNGSSFEISLSNVDANLLDEAKSNFEAWCANNGASCSSTGDRNYTIQ